MGKYTKMIKIKKFNNLKIKIFSDGANKEQMIETYKKKYIKGLTTNPTLMHKAGIKDYKKFSIDILKTIKSKPLSLEVFADDFEEMERQAIEISNWGKNVYVKIPITNTKGISSSKLIKKLSARGIKLNITAIMTTKQVKEVVKNLNPKIKNFISVFAGRIADTGIDPLKTMSDSVRILNKYKNFELIWASPRELLNIIQANNINCDIITVTNDLLNKEKLLSYNLEKFSLDTVKMFYKDAQKAGYKL